MRLLPVLLISRAMSTAPLWVSALRSMSIRAAFACLGLIGSQSLNAADGPPPTVLTVSSWASPGHLLHESLAQWCDVLAQRSNDRLQCDLLDRPIAPIGQTLAVVERAGVDLAIVAHGTDPARHVLSRLAELPMAAMSAESASVALHRTDSLWPVLAQTHAGVHVLAMFVQLPVQLFTGDRRVQSLDDVRGLRLRSGGGLGARVVETWRELNVRDRYLPITAIANEVADHQLDGALLGADNLYRLGLANTLDQGWRVPGGLYRQGFSLVINRAVWERLDADERRVLDAVGGEHAARLFAQAADRFEESLGDLLAESGMQWHDADAVAVAALRERLVPMTSEWISAAQNAGLPSARRVLGEYRRTVEQVQAQIAARR